MIWFLISFVAGVQAKDIYGKLNVKIEKMCDFIYFVLVDISLVGFLLPALLLTGLNYFVYDLAEESYILPTPTTYKHLSIKNIHMIK